MSKTKPNTKPKTLAKDILETPNVNTYTHQAQIKNGAIRIVQIGTNTVAKFARGKTDFKNAILDLQAKFAMEKKPFRLETCFDINNSALPD